MPMGVRNTPAVHQRRMPSALRHLIDNVGHVDLDDIIIWSQTLEEYTRNVRTVLQALQDTKLFCSLKKTRLFCTEVLFLKLSSLGRHSMTRGIEADPDLLRAFGLVSASLRKGDTFLFRVSWLYCGALILPNTCEVQAGTDQITTRKSQPQ